MMSFVEQDVCFVVKVDFSRLHSIAVKLFTII
jgi:hypothetical protein